jgi:hypothetical protein
LLKFNAFIFFLHFSNTFFFKKNEILFVAVLEANQVTVPSLLQESSVVSQQQNGKPGNATVNSIIENTVLANAFAIGATTSSLDVANYTLIGANDNNSDSNADDLQTGSLHTTITTTTVENTVAIDAVAPSTAKKRALSTTDSKVRARNIR